ncbi:MAG TPA: cation-transporting P-type ATPase [Methyloceanibacter sp.]|nr:cation-transporting P-type ATPase [Methyloceanibacter sp.]
MRLARKASRSDAPGESVAGAAEGGWHAQSAADIIAALATSRDGLSAEEAKARLGRYGFNRLAAGRKQSEILRFLSHFNNVLIYVLIAAAGLAAMIGHFADAAVVMTVVLVNATIGYVQEGRAEKALEAIRGMIDPQASVVRGGRRAVIAAENIVPGDLVLLEPGDRVPADLRLIRARNLRIDEAALTGESVPVDKTVAPVAAEAPLGDRTSMVFSGTLVASGTGTGVAVATGAQSQLGRISTVVGTVETLTTPLIKQMNQLARKLTVIILLGSAAVFVFAVLVRGYHWQEAFMVMVGLAVAAIPEGLPVVMTITLAIGVQRMAASNAIISRLPAVETLGSVSVICSDKTGTLTRNEMTVRAVLTADGRFEVSGSGYRPEGTLELDGRVIDAAEHPVLLEAARAAILCNDAELRSSDGTWVVNGDSMEGALVSFGIKAGHDAELLRKQVPRTDEIPFGTQHKFMATLHHGHLDGAAFAYIKGAPERILTMCSRQRGPVGDEPLDREFWRNETDAMARRGRRVLAVAIKALPRERRDLSFADVEDGATLLCLLGLIDPPREEALPAIRECQQAGIAVKMITGDHAETAEAIARELQLAPEPRTITGPAIDRIDDARLKEVVREVSVFARTSPSHKLRLVMALQADDAVTAMTGDGVNDAPALKRADVGVAMGKKGTEAAKQAAEMILADDNFASIVAAVREGRTVYDNLRKVIEWTLPTNGGEASAIIVALAFGLTLPMTAIQILWINLVTAVTLGLALAFEPTEPGAMRRRPRGPSERFLSGRLLWRTGFVSLLFVAGAFGMFYYATERGLSVDAARTMVVNSIVVMEIFYLFSVRYIHGTSLTWQGVLGTPAVLIAVAIVVAAQFAFTYLPFMQDLFRTEAVSLSDGALIIGIGVALLIVVELEKRLTAAFSWQGSA